MNNGWIKLHRQALYSQIRRKDPTAWRLFETLLLLVDRRTGVWSGGRDQIALADGVLKPGAIFKAAKRLKKLGMIDTQSNNRFTTISICKWGDYQNDGNSQSKNEVKTKQKPSNTLTRSKKKEVRNTNVETQSVYDHYITQFGKNPNTYKLTPKRKQKINARLRDAGEEMLLLAISNTAQSNFHRGDNDRAWSADLDWIVRSYEQVERLASLNKQDITNLKPSEVEGDMEYVL